ncbi:MAG: ParB/RepB/Spo0J family partition protein [Ruminococcaceae bacterium]|nr:ParB/RepB/Spo0J family partition protein [Oscillospiraceae bacterium]
MAKDSVSSLLTSVDELFTTQEERDIAKRETVMDIPLAEISDFPNHPFKVTVDEKMLEMADSVKRYGVLVPAIVRPKQNGGYEMIAGHRRKKASELAERPTLNCIVRELTDDEAIIIMVDSNLQREVILPSEKAFAYKMKLDAMKRQGQRTDLTSTPMEPKLSTRSNEQLAAESPDSRAQIQRFIRLTHLIPEMLDMVDENKIALRPAVELSYLAEKEQRLLYEEIGYSDCTPSHAQAIKMRKFAEQGQLTAEVISSIMQEEKPNQKEQFRMPREKISKYFPAGTPAEKIEDTIIKALELYRRRQRDMER